MTGYGHTVWTGQRCHHALVEGPSHTEINLVVLPSYKHCSVGFTHSGLISDGCRCCWVAALLRCAGPGSGGGGGTVVM